MAMAAGAGAEASQMPFIKNLASSDRKLRTQSLEALQSFLNSRGELPLDDARKLWTGLYYALWMTDRPRPQQALAADLANLLFGLRAACAAPWLRAFWLVLSAQWPSIDALRMDKFLLLARRGYAAHVRWVKQRGYGADEHVPDVARVLREVCLDVDEEARVALGLRLHILDICIDELENEGVLSPVEDDEPLEAVRTAFVQLFGDMVEELRRSPVKSVRERAKEAYADERLPWATREEGDDDDEMGESDGGADDEGWGGIDD
ncbi:nucleolar protein NOP52 variant [Drechmeria coniospora]|uniref:Nucleolar protein NOP52 variant n=1 Tax=Drechmeria coniospora TaxID=98403 RepID=A0A151GBF4_DRECN|nr:nucleolar protein NOP52 variant [Drechmeria coniospora]KYK54437.1 nucleolar protein NOP52 variant [Drechmeria coniospora]